MDWNDSVLPPAHHLQPAGNRIDLSIVSQFTSLERLNVSIHREESLIALSSLFAHESMPLLLEFDLRLVNLDSKKRWSMTILEDMLVALSRRLIKSNRSFSFCCVK